MIYIIIKVIKIGVLMAENTKIRMVQMEVVPGNPRTNYFTCLSHVNRAKAEGIRVLVFPELCISGYLIGDMWEELAFLEDCEHFGAELAKESTKELAIVFGNVFVDRDLHGTDGRVVKLNGAFVAMNGEFHKDSQRGIVYPKALLPNYREFEEPRHFKDLQWYCERKFGNTNVMQMYAPITIDADLHIGLTICEDGWDRDYDIKPVKNAIKRGANLILNLSCSPFTLNKNVSRDRVFSAHARDNKVPLCYVNSIGLQNNGKTLFTFDGSTVAYDKNGNTIANAKCFTDNVVDVTFNHDTQDLEPVVATVYEDETEVEQIHNALIYGIRTYMKQSKLKRVVIGSSGGVDSAVAAALYAEAIGKNNLMLVNMPSKFNSKTTIGLSEQLAKNIGCFYTTIPISDSVDLTKEQINDLIVPQLNSGDGYFDNSIKLNLSSFDLENVQARDRSSRILSAVASAFGGVFTNNGNKTESTVGYCTMYGDLAGFLAAIGDLWKTQVYELGKYMNRNGEIIPQGIFDIIPSAELSEEQCLDNGKGDPIIYWYHDNLFKAWIERWDRVTPTEIMEHYIACDLFKFLGINKPEEQLRLLFPTPDAFVADLERWWNLFKGMAIAKRVQAPPVLALSRRSFGFDYRETLNCVYYSQKYLNLKRHLGVQ